MLSWRLRWSGVARLLSSSDDWLAARRKAGRRGQFAVIRRQAQLRLRVCCGHTLCFAFLNSVSYGDSGEVVARYRHYPMTTSVVGGIGVVPMASAGWSQHAVSSSHTK